ncbi:MAG: rod shape-determining protein RodA, partial [Treponema sp.]|nr:rod shape-determining protein RodA [Treponema sp.]
MKKIFLMFDYVLLLVIFSLVTLGVIFIYSSSVNIEGVSVTNEYIKQIIWFSIGFIVLIFTTIYDYRKLESKAVYLYIALI